MNGLYLVAVCVLAVSVDAQLPGKRLSQEEYDARIGAFREPCLAMSAVDPDVFAEAQRGNLDSNDQGLKRYMACIFMMDGSLKSNGDFSMDKLTSIMPNMQVYMLTGPRKYCNAESGYNAMDKAMNINMCFRQQLGPYHYRLY